VPRSLDAGSGLSTTKQGNRATIPYAVSDRRGCGGKGETQMAKYLMSWKTRAAGTAQQNHDDGKSLLDAFAKWQIPADQNYKEFLSRVDGQAASP